MWMKAQSTTPDKSCRFALISSQSPCGLPGVTYIVGGCLHEHIIYSYFCAEHRDRVLNGQSLCPKCWSMTAHHRCSMLAREVPHAY
jgi:hypothetical protein